MTIEELEQAMEEARGRRDAAIADLKTLGPQLDQALAQQKANDAVALWSDAEKAAVIQALGVESTVQIGKPGEPSGA